MVGPRRAANVADDDEQFDTQALIRLTAWGLTALVSIVALVFAARTDLGAKRVSAALIAIAAPPEEAHPPAVQLLARAASAEREARRAVETAAALSADRERMATKVSSLEHEISEINGSVARALALATEGRSAAPIFSMSSSGLLAQFKTAGPGNWAAAAPTGASTEPAPEPQKVALAITPSHRPGPAPGQISPQISPRADPPAAPKLGPPQTLAPAPPPEPIAAPKTDEPAAVVTGSVAVADTAQPPKVEFGVDLGPATTLGRLRSRWTKISTERPDLVKGLRPLVTVRDIGASKPVELRLVVGPLANVHLAADFCAALASQQHVCRPAVFDGQRLNVQ